MRPRHIVGLLALVAILLAPFKAANAHQSSRLTGEHKARIDSLLCCSPMAVQVGAPGYAAAIVQGGTVTHHSVSGFRDLSENLPMTTATLINVASITKTFTATLTMILRDRGQIDLDDEVAEFLPEGVSFPSSDPPITIYHLLTHTSGLPSNPPNRVNMKVDGPIDAGVALPYDIADLYAGLSRVALLSPPGERWRYSNFGYGLLGHVLELAMGETYETLLTTHLLQPLGMNDTVITLGDRHRARLAASYWVRDPERRERPHKEWGQVNAQGGITSSLEDMIKYAAFQLKTEDEQNDPLPLTSLLEMRLPRAEFDVFGGRPRGALFQNVVFEMGLGWWISRSAESGERVYWHGGEVDGHTSVIIYSTERDAGVVLMTNLGGAGAIPLGFALAAEVFRDK